MRNCLKSLTTDGCDTLFVAFPEDAQRRAAAPLEQVPRHLEKAECVGVFVRGRANQCEARERRPARLLTLGERGVVEVAAVMRGAERQQHQHDRNDLDRELGHREVGRGEVGKSQRDHQSDDPDQDQRKQALAMEDGTLQRNFQGYSTRRECDLVGLGVSSIGKVGDCYAQNIKDILTWQSVVDEGKLPIWRGISLSTEDRLRRRVIESIMCHGEVSFERIEAMFAIDFHEHFAPELLALEQMEADGLLEMSGDDIRVTPPGRLLLRNIAMTFDEYLQEPAETPRYSRVI